MRCYVLFCISSRLKCCGGNCCASRSMFSQSEASSASWGCTVFRRSMHPEASQMHVRDVVASLMPSLLVFGSAGPDYHVNNPDPTPNPNPSCGRRGCAAHLPAAVRPGRRQLQRPRPCHRAAAGPQIRALVTCGYCDQSQGVSSRAERNYQPPYTIAPGPTGFPIPTLGGVQVVWLTAWRHEWQPPKKHAHATLTHAHALLSCTRLPHL